MPRRIVILAFVLLGLSACATVDQGYYRQGYYSDGGYYYPAEDGYGDYYEGPEDVDYRYYDSYSYSPFWRLDRYTCSVYYSCSPYWGHFYGRPYSGWSFSFGSHWRYGSWGWYGHQWSPWYDDHHYWHRPRHPRPDTDTDAPRPPDRVVRPRPGLREPGVIDPDGGGYYGPRGPRPIPGVGTRPVPGGAQPDPRPEGDVYVRPLPRPDFGDDGEPRKGSPRPVEPAAPGGARWPTPPQDRDYRRPVEPGYRRPVEADYRRPVERQERRPVEADYRRPVERQERQERPPPRQEYREPVRVERPESRPAPRVERSEPREVRPASQNRTTEDEQ
jgi:hypothetical protein